MTTPPPLGWRPPPVRLWDELTISGAQELYATIVALAEQRDALLDGKRPGGTTRNKARALRRVLPTDPDYEVAMRRQVALDAIYRR